MRSTTARRHLAALTCLTLASSMLMASTLTVQVSDAGGLPLPDVAVYAEAVGGAPATSVRGRAQIEQRARKFAPLVTVVQTGAEISFPNNDSVRHHVYSFSAPKTFDIKLYSGVPGSPIAFDKPGTVVIGCNIHDQMVAYIHIVNTPHFGKTDASGKLSIEGLAPGKYTLKAWHYDFPPGAAVVEQPLTMTAANGSAAFKLNVKPVIAAN